jgi:hypothetical protein
MAGFVSGCRSLTAVTSFPPLITVVLMKPCCEQGGMDEQVGQIDQVLHGFAGRLPCFFDLPLALPFCLASSLVFLVQSSGHLSIDTLVILP